LGWVEGENIAIEYRYADGKEDRLKDLAAEFVHLNLDIIVTGNDIAVAAAKKLTQKIPIVMAGTGDPIGGGLVASLASPGGNVTGVTALSPDLSTKRLELLREAFPRVTRVAVLFYGAIPSNINSLKETEEAATELRVQLDAFDVRRVDDYEPAFSEAAQHRDGALLVLRNSFNQTNRNQIVALAAKAKLPTMYPLVEYVDSGGLMSYGVNTAELTRRAAVFVDKILKGARPADLPVEQPTKFDFVINLKAAKQIGLTIPPNVLARADRVIK
jgi:putative ABC transport system substrate-binding protein